MGIVKTCFEVSEVEPGREPLKDETLNERYAGGTRVVGSSHPTTLFVTGSLWHHPLLVAAHQAFLGHYPLVLSPDVVWLTLLQGLTQHIDANAEELRSHFVFFPGKFSLKIESLGGPHMGSQAIEEFSNQLRRYIKPEAYELIVCDFSTTDATARVASEAMLMAAMKYYFDYEMFCICGIPRITLEGSPEDWGEVARRARLLENYGLQEWSDKLAPILEQFVAASRGSVDRQFWNDLYQYHPNPNSTAYETGDSFSGWVGRLYPYLADGSKNPLLSDLPQARSESTEDLFANEPDGIFFQFPASRGDDLESQSLDRGFEELFGEPGPTFDTALENSLPLETPPTPTERTRRPAGGVPGLTLDAFARGTASTPVSCPGRKLTFEGGLLGVVQDQKTKELRPLPGYLVLESG